MTSYDDLRLSVCRIRGRWIVRIFDGCPVCIHKHTASGDEAERVEAYARARGWDGQDSWLCPSAVEVR